MPDNSSKPRGRAYDTRSQELTKNVVTTRMQLENHFKSIRKREAAFKKQKLTLLEPQLAAAQRMARPATVAAPKGRMQGASPRALGAGLDHTTDSPRDLSSAPAASRRPGFGRSTRSGDSASRLDRCWSSPGDLQSPASASGGRLGSGWQTPMSPGMSCHRASASVPVSSHPSIHPGAVSSRPTVSRPIRSLSATGPPGSPAGRAIGSPAGRTSAGGWTTPGSPGTVGQATTVMAPTPDLQSAISSPSRHQFNSMRGFSDFSGATSPCTSPSNRRAIAGDRLSFLLGEPGSPGDFQEDFLLAGLDADDDTPSSLIGGGGRRRVADPPEAVERLGELMALLGPRYKTLPRDVLWQRAEKGEMTPAQRKLHRSSGHGAGANVQRSRPSSSVPALLGEASDPDGKARAAWLAALSSARAAQRKNERKERSSMGNAFGGMEKEMDLVDGASAGKAALAAFV